MHESYFYWTPFILVIAFYAPYCDTRLHVPLTTWHFSPSTKLYSVSLPSYYDYNVCNMTFFLPYLSYNIGNSCAYVVEFIFFSRFTCDWCFGMCMGTMGNILSIGNLEECFERISSTQMMFSPTCLSSLCIQNDVLHWDRSFPWNPSIIHHSLLFDQISLHNEGEQYTKKDIWCFIH